MSDQVKINNKTLCATEIWDEMITEARERIAALEKAINLYTEKRNAGEPWPGQQSKGQAA